VRVDAQLAHADVERERPPAHLHGLAESRREAERLDLVQRKLHAEALRPGQLGEDLLHVDALEHPAAQSALALEDLVHRLPALGRRLDPQLHLGLGEARRAADLGALGGERERAAKPVGRGLHAARHPARDIEVAAHRLRQPPAVPAQVDGRVALAFDDLDGQREFDLVAAEARSSWYAPDGARTVRESLCTGRIIDWCSQQEA